MERVKKNFALMGITVVLLTVTVIGAVVDVELQSGSNKSGHDGSITMTQKVMDLLCQHTDYKPACRKSLANVNNTNNPRELVKAAFKSAIKEVQIALGSSYTLKELAMDPRASKALDRCKEVLNISIHDLKRSLEKVDNLDVAKIAEYIGDLKIWLSGSLMYQETCQQGFKNTRGEADEKMKKLLGLLWKLTSNALTMVNGFSEVLGEAQLTGASHRLLEKGPNDNAWWAAGEKWSNLNVDPKTLKPNVVVAQDGSGTFSTIMDAVRSVPPNNKQRFVIFIKQGTYMEYVDIPDGVDNIVFIGEGPTKTRISGDRSYNDVNDTYRTATVGVNGAGFMAKGIGFENTSGPLKHQAVALRVSGDRAIFYNCAMDGYQDTLYVESQRQFYRHCTIRGTVDFIFGDAQAVFQDCKIIVRKPLENQVCVITAQGRKDTTSKGALIIQGCTITAEPAYMATNPMPKSYLGRPWEIYSRTIIMQSFIDRNISPEGWLPWDETRVGLDTCHYAEYNNKGPGANTAQRVNWKGIKKISPQEADSYTPRKYIHGGLWIKPTGVPYDPGMMNV